METFVGSGAAGSGLFEGIVCRSLGVSPELEVRQSSRGFKFVLVKPSHDTEAFSFLRDIEKLIPNDIMNTEKLSNVSGSLCGP